MAYPDVVTNESPIGLPLFSNTNKTFINHKTSTPSDLDDHSFISEKVTDIRRNSMHINEKYLKSKTTSTTPLRSQQSFKTGSNSISSASSPHDSDYKFNMGLNNISYSNKINSNMSKDQTEKGLLNFYVNNKEKFEERVRKGPPKSYRWLSWIIISKLSIERSEDSYLSIQQKTLDEKQEIQIKKDLNRTISEQSNYNLPELQDLLYRVLRAFAITDPTVGYCQGMNFIVSFMLILSDFNEVDTYYLLLTLFSNTYDNRFGVRGFYLDGFPLLMFYNFAFNRIFENYHFLNYYHLLHSRNNRSLHLSLHPFSLVLS